MFRDTENIDDGELLARFYADGHNEWLGILLERYTLLLLGVCMKYLKQEELAKDMVQQVLLKALSEIPKYRIDNIGGWLYRVAQNRCLSHLRDKKIWTDEYALQFVPEPETVPMSQLIRQEQYIDQLKEELLHLKEPQRICITLFYLEQKSYRQIAAETGWSEKLVKSHIQNGKRNLKIRLES